MPIYAYRCSACGHAQDVLQKLSDPLLTQCPACGQATFTKQLTAAGFQLKGSGWYATDFRNNGSPKAAEGGKSDGDKTDKGDNADKATNGDKADAGSKSDSPGGTDKGAKSDAGSPAPSPAASPASPPSAS